MHILLAIVGAVGAIAFFLWRVQMGVTAAKEIAREVGDPRQLVRRARWTRGAKRNPLESLTDPREAATVLMIAVGREAAGPYRGLLAEPMRETIEGEMTREFAMSAAAAGEMLAQMSFLMNETADVGPRLRPILRPIRERCSAEERGSLLAILRDLSRQAGGPTPIQTQLIAMIERLLSE